MICKILGHLWHPLEWLELQAHPLGYSAIRFWKCSRCGATRMEGRFYDPAIRGTALERRARARLEEEKG